ncbi:hypothetical protein L9F63_012995 [Diploptera punctata]|uniref:beta-glucosidase n=1 Tax=Diploptera punctata TaxID=6984 RepID=A0AAD8EMQ2_DIPPU|nr:hypothetical protein L9F63_012995 [Diploptera punctata]
MNLKLVSLSIIAFTSSILCAEVDLTFPDDFMFGAATASYQIEGAWNVDGKGESIWDHYSHNYPEYMKENATGDDAAKSYYKYKEDVKALKDMGMNHYRFSISWPRIFPTGLPNNVNEKGIKYYNNLINELLKYNITPVVTMFHWDLPQYLQNLGGWTNEIIVQYFEDFARILYERYGDRVSVKWWLTFNEIQNICFGTRTKKTFAPEPVTPGIGYYLTGHNILKAHARAYRLYEKEFPRDKQHGKISIAKEIMWPIALNESSECDQAAVNKNLLFTSRWLLDPIFSKQGDYPQELKDIIANKSKEQGFKQSRLPTFTPEEVKYIRGTADYLGLNEYTSYLVTMNEKKGNVSMADDMGVTIYISDTWITSKNSAWLSMNPQSMRSVLNWFKDNYGEQYGVLITENGFADGGDLDDDMRIKYYGTYFAEMLKAIHIDKVKMIGHSAWALIDNLEWTTAYTSKFGLYHVDFKDPERKRTPKKSSYFMKNLTSTRRLPEEYLKLSDDLAERLKTRGKIIPMNLF